MDYSVVTGINWKKLRKVLPAGPRHGNDRAPTLEEIRKILKVCGLRLRAAVLIMASGGVRIGSFDYFLLRDFEAVREGEKVLAGKLTVYRGEREEYSTFISPEAVAALEEYLELRRRGGEQPGPLSPLIRDEWNWRDGDVKKAKRMSTVALNKGL
jgi:integrase